MLMLHFMVLSSTVTRFLPVDHKEQTELVLPWVVHLLCLAQHLCVPVSREEPTLVCGCQSVWLPVLTTKWALSPGGNPEAASSTRTGSLALGLSFLYIWLFRLFNSLPLCPCNELFLSSAKGCMYDLPPAKARMHTITAWTFLPVCVAARDSQSIFSHSM